MNKLALYILIMIFMFGGTGLILYRNNLLPGLKPSASDNSAPAEAAVAGEQTALGQTFINPLKIDLTIFSREKFKALAENILANQASPALGKSDIFKPN